MIKQTQENIGPIPRNVNVVMQDSFTFQDSVGCIILLFIIAAGWMFLSKNFKSK
jgi:hypothetical protein